MITAVYEFKRLFMIKKRALEFEFIKTLNEYNY